MSAVLDPRTALVRRYLQRGGFVVVAALLLGIFPLFPVSWVLWLGVGVAGGIYIAWSMLQAKRLSEVERVGARYQQTTIPDCTFTDQTFLGYGMEFAQYREAFDRVTADKGRLSPAEHKALHNELVRQMTPVYISDDDLTRHMMVMASTGLGKTELFQAMILPSVIKRGGGCLVFDAKGNENLITSVYAMAREFHREEDVIFINLSHPEYSHTYNPLNQSGTRQIVSTLMKLFSKRGQEFFRDFARTALVAAIICIKGQPKPIAFNFMDLRVLFSDYHAFEKLYHTMPDDTEDKAIVWSFLQTFHGTDRDGNDYVNTSLYTERLTGLANKMLDFSHSEYKRVLNDYSPDLELKSAILGNKIIVVVIPALQDKEGVESFGKLFLGDFARAIGEIQENRTKPSPPFIAFLDEFGSFADPSQTEIFAQARSAGIALVPSVQTRGLLDKVEPFFADNILGNCWHHIYFDVRDSNSRDSVARLAGETVRRYRTESTSENFGTQQENVQTGARHTESRGKSVSRSARESNEDLISATDFAMDPGNAIMLAKSGIYRMVLPMVRFERQPPRMDEIVLARFDKLQVPGLNLMANSTGYRT